MALLIKNIVLPLTAEESSLKQLAARALAMPENSIRAMRVARISTDARKKDEIVQLYSLRVELDARDEERVLKKGRANIEADADYTDIEVKLGTKRLESPPVVIGMGPAGLFAAYTLAKYGYKPVLLERGRSGAQRNGDVERFCAEGILDPESNVMFGEGGAGAFSDGKLMTRIKDPRAYSVIRTLARFGAPQEILVQAKPHVGTDKLKKTVEGIRKEIVSLGGEVRFETKLTGVDIQDGRLRAVFVQSGSQKTRLECSACVLAIGQGARDSYRMLSQSGLILQAKAFAVGVRVEHPREMIDAAQFGKWAGNARLGAAEYHLSEQVGDRGVYTFCMCPGGVVIPSSSGMEQVVTNGMSYYARNAENSNAAIVVQVSPKDFGSEALSGMLFQEEIEKKAFLAGGGNFFAPACCVGDFLKRKTSSCFGDVKPSYRPGTVCADIDKCLPDFVTEPLRTGIEAFGRRIRNYAMHDAVITAVESRTSSPVRILRDENGEAAGCLGMYPVGEGAGYAGGIVSAAVDGMRASERIMSIFRP